MDKKRCSEFVDSIGNLSNRLNINTKYGDNDLGSWLTKNLDVKKGERVLDVGCGDGTHLRSVAKIVNIDDFCIGMDYDAEMIKKAKDLTKNFKPSIKFVQLSMDDIGKPEANIENDHFDLIYSVYAFYYAKNEFETLNTLKSKLNQNGRISIVGPYRDNNKSWFDFLNQFMELPDAIIHSSSSFMDGIEKYAHENFKQVKSLEFVNNITLPTYDELKKYWISNIYYDPKLDAEFEKFAKEHFKKHKIFSYYKKAQMIVMSKKK